MKKFKYYLILIVLILVAVAFKYQSFGDKNSTETTKEVIPEKPEINYAIEIQDALTKYDSLLSTELKETGTVGAAVVITYKNQIALLKCYGVTKAGENNPINENTVFRLASVSKTITGVLAGILADEKVLDIDDKIIDYLPGFQLKDPASTNSLTIRNVLSHTSGLIPHAYDNLIEEHVPFETVLTRLSDVEIAAPENNIANPINVDFSKSVKNSNNPEKAKKIVPVPKKTINI